MDLAPQPPMRKHGPMFESHSCSSAEDGFRHLQAHVATTAFDSDQHFDAPKCHPNTRIAVMNEIMAWITLAVTRIQWILWLNGAAGAGKSAIGRSIVELCLAQSIPIAWFFFCRTDSTRNNIKPLVATIAHQIMQIIPEMKSILIPRIQDDPLIFKKSLRTQLKYLIFDPLREMAKQNISQSVLVLLFDGVDEFHDKEDQMNFIRTISNFMGSEGLHVIAFFGSRNEPQLTSVFRSKYISGILLQMCLDHKYSSDADIRVFLNDSFSKIKETHGLRHLLKPCWPTQADVDSIVNMSAGQFTYASAAIRFISTVNLNPAQQLEIIRRLRPSGKLTPFAQLDTLHQHIFSQIQEKDFVNSMEGEVREVTLHEGTTNELEHEWAARGATPCLEERGVWVSREAQSRDEVAEHSASGETVWMRREASTHSKRASGRYVLAFEWLCFRIVIFCTVYLATNALLSALSTWLHK